VVTLAEITWLGHACFRLKSKDATIIADPYDKSLGLGTIGQKADIVTISHEHPHHSTLSGIKGEPFVITGPGEYEVRGMFINGVWSYADDKQGKERGRNTIYLYHLDDLVVCHLGALGHPLSTQVVEDIGDVDVLLVPVGGNTSLTADKASEVISLIEPKVVIPMHYSTGRETAELDNLDKFTKVMGLKEYTPQEKFSARASDLNEATQIVVLEAKA